MGRQSLRLALKPNDMVGRWCVIRKLGEGGCGTVWLARNLKNPQEEVALKVLENHGDEKRFKREMQLLAGHKHPFMVKLLDSGRHQGFSFLALEFMAGGSLRDWMDKRGAFPPKEAAWAMVMAIRGLRASRTVHRDLKPENLLLTKPSQGLKLIPGDIRKGVCLKVADFGLAKAFDPSMTKLTHTGQIMGTPLYMSPEQCRNTRDVTFHSDVYSLGVLFYELVLGKPPFDADNAYDLMAKHVNEAVAYPRGFDPALRAVCDRCLAKNPRDRYASLLALERDLGKVAGLGEPEPDPGLRWTTWVILIASLSAFVAIAWILKDQLRKALGL